MAGHYYRMTDYVINEKPEHSTVLWDLLIAKDLDILSPGGKFTSKGVMYLTAINILILTTPTRSNG